MSNHPIETHGRPRDAAPIVDLAGHDEEEAPAGTFFLMMLFLAAIAGLWWTLHWMLLTG